MRFKKFTVALIIGLVITLSILIFANRTTRAQESTDSSKEILNKLDSVLNNQKTILQSLASLKEELYVVKIRVTQGQ